MTVDTARRLNRMLIGGEWVDAIDGRQIEVESPADRKVIGVAPRASAADVDRAVAAAAKAFPGWRTTAPRERGRMISAIADEIVASSEDLARELARETGNAIRTTSRPEVLASADFFRYYGGLASELKGEVVPFGDDLFYYTTREPFGVVGAIVSWNAPVSLAATKITMAIVTGNTVVLKAPEYAPLAILKLAEACQRHLPAGVVNVVTGTGKEAGAALVQHPTVAKLTFTGSTEVGREIGRAAGDRVIPVTLELGGKSPAIVFQDSDSDTVADGVIAGMRFTRQGQGCTAGSRLFVHESIFDSFLARLSGKVTQLRVGDPLDEATDIGSIISRTQFERVCSYIKEALSSGGRVVVGGLPPTEGPLSEGYYLEPTVIVNVDHRWRIAREEIFGPVLVAIPWSSDQQVIDLANDTHYGLSAYIWCRDISRALQTARSIDSGGVQINRGLGQAPGMSDGGIKMSGHGREHSMQAAIDGFTYLKSFAVGLHP